MIHHPPKYLSLYIWRHASDFETGRSWTKRLWQWMLCSFLVSKRAIKKTASFQKLLLFKQEPANAAEFFFFLDRCIISD